MSKPYISKKEEKKNQTLIACKKGNETYFKLDLGNKFTDRNKF